MATSKVEITNLALTLLGADLITSMSESTERARTANALFDSVRDAVLRSFPWNFAIRRTQVASLATPTPADTWNYYFTQPTGCLRVLKVDEAVGGREFVLERGYIACNHSPIVVKYIYQETDVTKYDALFVQALGARLAHAMAHRRIQSSAREEDLWKIYRSYVREARSVDSQEGTPENLVADDWLDSRGTGSVMRSGNPYL